MVKKIRLINGKQQQQQKKSQKKVRLFNEKEVQDCCTWLNQLFPEDATASLAETVSLGEVVVTGAATVVAATSKVLILRPDGVVNVVRIKELGDTNKYTNDYAEILYVARGYTFEGRNELLPRPRIIACAGPVAASQEPQEKENPWSPLVNILRGFYEPLYGNIVLMGEDPETGNHASLPLHIIDLFRQYAKTSDREAFLMSVYERNHVESYL